ncbi:SUMF1/EgtB/PvdO family nonheme iron enzyme [Treponema denticola]|uniref:SUMF1/EgtB/PvdO family nonheme iron enzyme n=1 Tax=Treponema denticola TaxID=158 RepID=UPI0022051C14|nr:SUMF1/EgtB/PvdO family nonheme iron enzyme [Treponema denticola]
MAEWCWDWYNYDYELTGGNDPIGAPNGFRHIVRGGSWRDENTFFYAAGCRSYSSDLQDYIGFRIVCRP